MLWFGVRGQVLILRAYDCVHDEQPAGPFLPRVSVAEGSEAAEGPAETC